MKKYEILQTGADVTVANLDCLELRQTLDCGQAFRWREISETCWEGVAHGRILRVHRRDRDFILENMKLEEYKSVWHEYFDIDRNYSEIIKSVSNIPLLREAAEYGFGIRVLKQDIWEMICSFIISQNNNIPRIKGIISRFCETFGDKLSPDLYAFPRACDVAAAGLAGLAPLRAGFRTKYLLDAAEKVAAGQIPLSKLSEIPLTEAREILMSIKGVGPKVADCVLLFGGGRAEAFPVDVWIKRVMQAHFPEGLPNSLLPHAGIIQQYLFYGARTGIIET